jgi:hypothetical protein
MVIPQQISCEITTIMARVAALKGQPGRKGQVPVADSTIAHLKLLPGLVEDYQDLTERSMVS